MKWREDEVERGRSEEGMKWREDEVEKRLEVVRRGQMVSGRCTIHPNQRERPPPPRPQENKAGLIKRPTIERTQGPHGPSRLV